jgi:hypothetical protein
LLIDEHIPNRVFSARVVRLHRKGSPIRGLSYSKLAVVAGVVPVSERVLKVRFDFGRAHARTNRLWRAAATFCRRILRTEDAGAAAQLATSLLSKRYRRER